MKHVSGVFWWRSKLSGHSKAAYLSYLWVLAKSPWKLQKRKTDERKPTDWVKHGLQLLNAKLHHFLLAVYCTSCACYGTFFLGLPEWMRVIHWDCAPGSQVFTENAAPQKLSMNQNFAVTCFSTLTTRPIMLSSSSGSSSGGVFSPFSGRAFLSGWTAPRPIIWSTLWHSNNRSQ